MGGGSGRVSLFLLMPVRLGLETKSRPQFLHPSEHGVWPILALLTTRHLSKANSTKVQEDLEAEFQSLFSLLEELKEGMLMKIKQDRASRTYELQVCVYEGLSHTPTQPRFPTAPLRLSRAHLASASSSKPAPPPHIAPWRCLQVSAVSRTRHPSVIGLISSFSWSLLCPFAGCDPSVPTHLLSLISIPTTHLHRLFPVPRAPPPHLAAPPLQSSPRASSFSALPTGPHIWQHHLLPTPTPPMAPVGSQILN